MKKGEYLINYLNKYNDLKLACEIISRHNRMIELYERYIKVIEDENKKLKTELEHTNNNLMELIEGDYRPF